MSESDTEATTSDPGYGASSDETGYGAGADTPSYSVDQGNGTGLDEQGYGSSTDAQSYGADPTYGSDQGYGGDQSDAATATTDASDQQSDQSSGEVDPNSVTYGEAQVEASGGGGQVSLSDEQIAGILQQAGAGNDVGYA